MDESEQDKSTVQIGHAGTADTRIGDLLEDALKSAASPTDLSYLPDIGNRNRFIDDYEILNEPPRVGGMGVVYKARHLKLGRVVAVKMLLEGVAKDDTARKRFLKEARAIASLKHDNIIRVLDYGELDGRPFFTMEYIERNLASQIREHSLEPKEAARCVEVLALAVQDAHDHDVLHRDLKPSNILVDPEGKLLVADFGLAKTVTPGTEESITMKEQGVGTPSYMAPEQISGKACRQSDVYALGAILYFLLAGRPPFLGATEMETLMLLQSSEPLPPSQLNRRVTPDLEAVCLKCLEKSPGARYGSAKELGADLRRYLNEEPTLARPIGPVGRLYRLAKRHPREAALGCILAGVLLAGTVVSTLFYLKADESRAQYFSQYQKSQILRANDAASPLSQKLPEALALLSQVLRLNATNQLAAERLLFLLTHRQIPLPRSALMWSGEQILNTRFSSDGEQLLVLSTNDGRQLWLWDPLAAKLIRQTRLPGTDGIGRVAISPDLQRLALTESKDGQRTVSVYDVATERLLSKLGPLRASVRLLSFSDDGRSLRFFWRDGTVQTWSGGVHWSQPSEHSAVPLAEWATAASIGVVFSDDGRFLATTVGPATLGVWDASSGKRQALLVHGHDSLPRVAFGAGGSRLISYDPGLEGKPSELRVWNWRSGEPASQLKQPEIIHDPSLNADGSRLALVGEKHRQVRLLDVGAGHAVGEPIVCAAYPPVEAVFSPDGKNLLTITERNGRTAPDLGSAHGNGPLVLWDLQPRTRAPGALGQLSDVKHAILSQDGRRLAITQDPGANSAPQSTNYTVRIWDLPSQHWVGPALVHDSPVEGLAFNSDATLLITASQDTKARLWAVGTDVVRREFVGHSNWVSHVEFNRAGPQVLTSDRDGTARLWILGSSTASRLLHEGDEKIRLAALSPDGRWAVTAAEDDLARLWDLRTLQCVATQAASATVSQIVFSPDSSCVALAAGDNQGTVQVWPTPPTGAAAKVTHLGHAVNHLAFSPDGRTLLASGAGGFARFHDVATLEIQGAPLEHQPDVQQAVFSHDGERAATLAKDGSVIVWNLAWRSPVSDRMDSGLDRALGIAFDGSAEQLITYGLGGVKLLEVPRAPKKSPTWLPELAEIVAGQRFHGADVAQPVSIERFDSLRASLLSAPATDGMTRWAHWFLDQPASRSNAWR